MNNPKLLQTYLLNGTIEGVKIIELSESNGSDWKLWKTRTGEQWMKCMREGEK